MSKYILILIGLLLIIIFIQDIKSRLISVYSIVLLAILSSVFWYINSNEIKYILFSLGFVILNLTSLKVYTILMKKEKTEDLIYGLGLGDILFFIAVIPLFSTMNYMLFFISGMIISIVMYKATSFISKNSLIPLAGYLSVYLVFVLLVLAFANKSNYIDLIHL